MKKLLSKFTFLLIAVLCVNLVACGDDNDDNNSNDNALIVGTWSCYHKGFNLSYTETITFNNNGTYVWKDYYDTAKGTFVFSNKEKKLTLYSELTPYHGETYDVILSENQITLVAYDEYGSDSYGPFTKQ